MTKELEERIQAGKDAKEIIPLIQESADTQPTPEANDHYWKLILMAVPGHIRNRPQESKPKLTPMSDKAVAEFDKTIMEFGAYKGKALKDVPIKYLEMLVSDNEWKQQIRRYLKSKTVQDRQED